MSDVYPPGSNGGPGASDGSDPIEPGDPTDPTEAGDEATRRQAAVDELLAEVRADDDAIPETELDTDSDTGGAPGRRPPGRPEGPPPEDPADVARLERVHAELLARAPEDRMEPRLDPVREVLGLLGDPQLSYRVIHVAGTNGKTSTARAVDALVRGHDLRTGRFTSPHLSRVTERISVDGEPLDAAAFVRAYEDVAPYLEMVDGRLRHAGEPPVTYFEALAVMALAAFADAPVDVAVLEVGLGGTWDATNVVMADVVVVTPISLDHTDVLGDTIAAIAAEKAGVIHPGAVVVTAEQPEAAATVLAERAASVGARLLGEGLDLELLEAAPAAGGQMLTLQSPAGTYQGVFVPVHGEHQAHNVLLALAAVEALLTGGERALDGDVVGPALAALTSPGRLELVRTSPAVLVDAAHNVAGAAALVAALEEAFAFSTLVGVVGVLQGKDGGGILDLLEPVLDEVVVTRSFSPRSVEVEDLAVIARDVFGDDRVHVAERLDDALVLAAERAEAPDRPGSGVLVTGSITLVGEARTLLRAGAAR